jgi:hypothetical protein
LYDTPAAMFAVTLTLLIGAARISKEDRDLTRQHRSNA